MSILGKNCILQKLHPKYNYLEAEIKQGINEYAITAVDMIARRMRIAFLNRMVTHEILPKVVKLMAKELKWDKGKLIEDYRSKCTKII